MSSVGPWLGKQAPTRLSDSYIWHVGPTSTAVKAGIVSQMKVNTRFWGWTCTDWEADCRGYRLPAMCNKNAILKLQLSCFEGLCCSSIVWAMQRLAQHFFSLRKTRKAFFKDGTNPLHFVTLRWLQYHKMVMNELHIYIQRNGLCVCVCRISTYVYEYFLWVNGELFDFTNLNQGHVGEELNSPDPKPPLPKTFCRGFGRKISSLVDLLTHLNQVTVLLLKQRTRQVYWNKTTIKVPIFGEGSTKHRMQLIQGNTRWWEVPEVWTAERPRVSVSVDPCKTLLNGSTFYVHLGTL